MRLFTTTLTLTIIALTAATTFAQEFTTQAAKEAKAAYETDLEAAKEKYKQSLTEAAVKAVEVGELEEVVRIKEVKDELDGKSAGEERELTRVLWKHKAGYFERLNDGHWIERTGGARALIFKPAVENEEYVEIAREHAIVRLYDAKATVLFREKRSRGFKPLYQGSWSRR